MNMFKVYTKIEEYYVENANSHVSGWVLSERMPQYKDVLAEKNITFVSLRYKVFYRGVWQATSIEDFSKERLASQNITAYIYAIYSGQHEVTRVMFLCDKKDIKEVLGVLQRQYSANYADVVYQEIAKVKAANHLLKCLEMEQYSAQWL